MRVLHRLAAMTAVTCVALFWGATVTVEVFGSYAQIAAIKELIVYGLAVLVPAVALMGISGRLLMRSVSAPAAVIKRRRMPWIAVNGLLILVPSALYLDHLAAKGAFGPVFHSVQALELVAGAVNLRLMVSNLMLGRQLARGGADERARLDRHGVG